MKSQKTLELLCFEDNDGDYYLIEDYLQEAGVAFHAKRVKRLSEGMELLKELRPDIVLLDLGLPDSVGIGTFKTINAKYPYLAIVVLTGQSDMETGLQAVQAGAQDFISKSEITPAFLSRTLMYAVERQELNRELFEARRKAEESDKLKSAFLANMSHELRTPMNAIIGFSELLQNTNNTDSKEKYTNIIMQNGEQLLNLLNDIIDISKIEAAQLKIIKNEFDLNKTLKNLHTVFSNNIDTIAKAGKVKLLLHIPDDILSLHLNSDERRIIQILSNLLSNAIKFTENGFIRFGYTIEDERIKLFVKDTGEGIAPEHLQLIFNRFEQANENAVLKGTGLGLAISKNLTELLGGNIWAESEAGKGAEFYFTLPKSCILSSNIRKDESSQNIGTDIPDWSKNTILVVEDIEENMIITTRSLRRTNVNVLKASTAEKAIEILKKLPEINLVLMDLRLPGIDGIEATKQIRSFNKNLPVIAITALTMGDEERLCRNAGCNGFLTKPVKPSRLVGYLRPFLK